MILLFLIAFFSLIGLLTLHEFSHFLTAKHFGVPVEEFGLGYPPRIFAKKIGGTVYSLNLLPFGAFVRIEEEGLGKRKIWQRMLVIAAGILSFWVIAAILISVLMGMGIPYQVSDEENALGAKVQILAVSPDSPAETSGLLVGDIIKEFKAGEGRFEIEKVKELQELTEKYAGQEVILMIGRGKETLEIKVTPRLSPPSGEGPIGVALARIALKKHPFYKAPIEGIVATFKMTIMIIAGLGRIITGAIMGRPLRGELIGPVGIFDIFVKAGNLGVSYFLQTVSIISLHIAVFNALPIPAADGGRLLFLAIEKIKGKPVDRRVEQKITTISFILLVFLAALVTIKDIKRIF